MTTRASASEIRPRSGASRPVTWTARSASASVTGTASTDGAGEASAASTGTVFGATVRSRIGASSQQSSRRLPAQRCRVRRYRSPGSTERQFAAIGRSSRAATRASRSLPRSVPIPTTASGRRVSTTWATDAAQPSGWSSVRPGWSTTSAVVTPRPDEGSGRRPTGRGIGDDERLERRADRAGQLPGEAEDLQRAAVRRVAGERDEGEDRDRSPVEDPDLREQVDDGRRRVGALARGPSRS